MKGEYIWIVFLFLVGGCSSKSTGDIMDISVNIESEGRMSEYFQEAELFFLETNDQALISNVDQVVLADNRIVLLGNFARNVLFLILRGSISRQSKLRGKAPESMFWHKISVLIMIRKNWYYWHRYHRN